MAKKKSVSKSVEGEARARAKKARDTRLYLLTRKKLDEDVKKSQEAADKWNDEEEKRMKVVDEKEKDKV